VTDPRLEAVGRTWDERNIWRASLPVRTLWLLAFVAVFALVPMLADRWTYDTLYVERLYDQDWARFFRELGWFPTWMIASLALWLSQRPVDAALAKRNAWLLVLAPGTAGLLCEVVKILVRRQRPELNAGEYGFRPWSEEPFSSAGLAFPSSHTMVAFAACTALARIFPGARWVWYSLALGCAVTRVMARAHFVSDIAVGALLGWCVGWGVWIAMRGRAAGTAGM
jgi:membrane-associated phospholipid phosphatase